MLDVAVAAKPVATPRRRPRWPLEVVALLLFYAAYAWIRDAHGRDTADSGDSRVAFAHGWSVLHLEQVLHLDPERLVQGPILGHLGLEHAVNGFYLLAHVTVTVSVLVFLLVRRPQLYRRCRNALLLVSTAALAGFAAYPTAPPRLLPVADIRDTLSIGGWWSINHGGIERIADPYAAMPSLHLGWSTWVALSLAAAVGSGRARWLFALYPALVTWVVLATGAHWLLDAVAGVALALGGWWASGVLARWSARSRAPA